MGRTVPTFTALDMEKRIATLEAKLGIEPEKYQELMPLDDPGLDG